MIPLYYNVGANKVPLKNPIYFFRKSMGKQPTNRAAVIILNHDFLHSTVDWDEMLPETWNFDVFPEQGQVHYDVETVMFQPMFDENVEPSAARDGSLASEPRRVQAILTLSGFVRALNVADLQWGINELNYAFDPVINFLEGSSTFDHTLAPNAQPFTNVGFQPLVWWSLDDGRTQEHESNALPDTSSPFYQRLNRFVFVRSVSRPVPVTTKFDDYQAKFNIQLLLVDPTSYEFIAPDSFENSNWISPSSQNENITDDTGSKTASSNETFVTPDRLWSGAPGDLRFGPGWREQSESHTQSGG